MYVSLYGKIVLYYKSVFRILQFSMVWFALSVCQTLKNIVKLGQDVLYIVIFTITDFCV